MPRGGGRPGPWRGVCRHCLMDRHGLHGTSLLASVTRAAQTTRGGLTPAARTHMWSSHRQPGCLSTSPLSSSLKKASVTPVPENAAPMGPPRGKLCSARQRKEGGESAPAHLSPAFAPTDLLGYRARPDCPSSSLRRRPPTTTPFHRAHCFLLCAGRAPTGSTEGHGKGACSAGHPRSQGSVRVARVREGATTGGREARSTRCGKLQAARLLSRK